MTDIQDRIQNSFNTQGLMKTLGARLLSVQEGEVQIELPFSTTLSQQHGYMHAGVTTAIVDNACGFAALTKAPAGYEIVSADFKMNMIRPAIGELLIATGRVESAGKMLTVCRGEVVAISGDSRKVVALMQATMVNVKI